MGPAAPAAGKGERDSQAEDGHPIASAASRRGGRGQVPGSAATPSGLPRNARVSPFFTLAPAAPTAPAAAPAIRSTPAGFHFHRGRSRTPPDGFRPRPPDGFGLGVISAEHSSAAAAAIHPPRCSCPSAAGAVAAQATDQTGGRGGYRIRGGVIENSSTLKGVFSWVYTLGYPGMYSRIPGVPNLVVCSRVPGTFPGCML
ncbi:unnamed protein product [Laminaria digitata]